MASCPSFLSFTALIITISQSLSPGATCISTTPVVMHYTRFASICQNSFNFESFAHYHKWHNHAAYAVYTKSAKFFPNHRKSTYPSGFMHFFRKFKKNHWTDNFSSKNPPPSLIFSSISASGFTRFPSRFPNSVDAATVPPAYPLSGRKTLDIRDGRSPPSSKTLSKRGFKSAMPFFHRLQIHLPIPYYNPYFSIIL